MIDSSKVPPLKRAGRGILLAAVLVIAAQVLVAHRSRRADPAAVVLPGGEPAVVRDTQRAELPNEPAFFAEAARIAWQHFDNVLWEPSTGLARATPHYERITPWDIGSILAATYSAHRLGLIDGAEYRKRMGTTLRTLERMPLYRDAVFHKKYSARNARMIDRSDRETRTGYGWSATDLGRILIWLHIVRQNEPQFRDRATRIAGRIRFAETVADGYLYGGLLGSRGQLWKFQEGRIGYEQYAARGYAFWKADVANALDLRKNARPIDIMGVTLLADTRGLDRLNSEPFVLAGIELGWSPPMRELALAVLEVQQARFRKTGQLTMVSEDALNVKPHYFYYYCVYCNGRAFVVDLADPGNFLDSPRWISTKAAFGYHVLVGSEYTRAVMEQITKARTANAWSSGVFEKTHEPTGAFDINTTAVILEAALYRKLGKPLIEG